MNNKTVAIDPACKRPLTTATLKLTCSLSITVNVELVNPIVISSVNKKSS